ncbi:MAG: hypothetical protein IBX72_11530 [Nitrospirae bacterium]|nr:hypothetical protein [Nitrospirota bacterium]
MSSYLCDNTLEGYREYNLDPQKELGTIDPVKIGKIVRNWLMEYMTSSDVVVLILEGNKAVANVRKLAGNTIPLFAAPGTIRGTFAIDSPDKACREKRAVYNLIHASGNLEEAQYEIKLWFPEFKEEK